MRRRRKGSRANRHMHPAFQPRRAIALVLSAGISGCTVLGGLSPVNPALARSSPLGRYVSRTTAESGRAVPFGLPAQVQDPQVWATSVRVLQRLNGKWKDRTRSTVCVGVLIRFKAYYQVQNSAGFPVTGVLTVYEHAHERGHQDIDRQGRDRKGQFLWAQDTIPVASKRLVASATLSIGRSSSTASTAFAVHRCTR